MDTPEPFEPKARRKKKVKETGRGGTEQTGRTRVVKAGGESLKWVSPGMNGVPDQIELYGVDEMMKLVRDTDEGREAYLYDDDDLRAFMVRLLAAAIRFTEYKAPGKKPTSNQLRVHERLRARGFTVSVVDTKETPCDS